METALSDLAARAHSSDVDFFATVVGIQFRLGGDLGTLLLGLGTSIQERLEFRRQVRALTAPPRLSARVLIVLPLVSLVLVYAFNRPYLEPLLSTPFGHLELALAAVLLAGGIAIIQAMSEVRP
jgi:tight adherence protein B